jgi:gas vesicle protein
MKSTNVVVGILGGIAIGAVLGILFAPAKGEKTRKRIHKKEKELENQIKQGFNGVVDGVKHQFEKITS